MTTSEFQISFSRNTPTPTGTESTVVSVTEAPAPAASTGAAQRHVVTMGIVGGMVGLVGMLV